MIKTAGLSSLGPVTLGLGRVLAAFESAIVGLDSLKSRIARCLQKQAVDLVAGSVKLWWVCDMRYGNCGVHVRERAVIA